MGLDVTLTYCKDLKASEAKEKEFEEKSEAIWEELYPGRKYEDLTDAEKKAARKRTDALKKEMGLDEFGSDGKNKKDIQKKSKIHPKHSLFQMGYFRSSYNGGGINSVLENLGLLSLYGIFERNDRDEYYFQPNWKKALENVKLTIERLKKEGGYRVESIGNMFIDPTITNEAEALECFKKQLEEFKARKAKDKNSYGAYSNRDGHFYLDKPLEIVAAIPGKQFHGKAPCTYIVTKGSDEDNQWYVEALEIVQETIEFVLAKKDIQNYYLAWSS